MDTIKFSYNWNNKLRNKAFTTIRLHNPNRYRKGEQYEIKLKTEPLGVAILHDVRCLTLSQLNDFICYLDTGYNLPETMQIFKRMYTGINWETQKIDFCLLVYVKQEVKQ